ncbi:hypothetical protein [Paraburkholderia megapolitana]|uniref:Uncharacterized protein n=1 Tax=Paraburkholderia megapolitana TaxID=420953 RepID=A0A1I3U5Y7_9BURK|nr:hypothetical protein [Paraburkholderia megapolitana]QDQ83634.1 hypothetical protein FNZ07_20925 [Paraburkholderia megapolitana]SFJ78988.1 hypothetical protein SAMN05192543_11133 [Paraburkholderia megapolitana]
MRLVVLCINWLITGAVVIGMANSAFRYHEVAFHHLQTIVPFVLAICAFRKGSPRWLKLVAFGVNALNALTGVMGVVGLVVTFHALSIAEVGALITLPCIANAYLLRPWMNSTSDRLIS